MPPKGSKKETGQSSQSSQNHGSSVEGETIPTIPGAQQFAEALIEALKNPVIMKTLENMIVLSVSKALDSAVKPLQEKIKQLEEKIEGMLMEAQNNIEEQNEKIQQLNKKVQSLSKGVTNISRQNKRLNLKVCGDNLEIQGGNKVASMLVILGQAGIQNVKENDISSLDKVSVPGKDNKNTYWLIKMKSESAKTNLYSQRTKLKNAEKKIFLNEDLTKEDAIIFRKARQRVKDGLLQSTWTWGGVVFGKCDANGKPFQIEET
jgi:DNA repair exonuclease SbcCD ATPase subunit